jgi:hypothetical protein
MSMADIRITQSALEQLNALDDDNARAVDAAIQAISEEPGSPLGSLEHLQGRPTSLCRHVGVRAAWPSSTGRYCPMKATDG